ncbi:hypothetical protein [Brevifollis gellanilyticus]|uniref:Uncharacterized protein n=1 Tax=Brevifollis gellanilyticus TaxID=748831 RepID=A0A512M808_9BACT|nr:hypothetical protein [Brevifollis gellanilyticus]GEP42855.1 hypothetical protein BGE01nite_21460 [Brevifollis gellanilyticus]
MSNLTPEQLAQVEQWAADGATLNDVQSRLKSELGIALTYLEARLLMVEVGVRIKDKPREQPKPEAAAPAAPEETPGGEVPAEGPEEYGDGYDVMPEGEAEAGPGGMVTLIADQITAPGALISGKVTFSDGQTANWSLDQFGRLALGGAPQGYQPPKGDIPQFQQQLDMIMQRAGF